MPDIMSSIFYSTPRAISLRRAGFASQRSTRLIDRGAGQAQQMRAWRSGAGPAHSAMDVTSSYSSTLIGVAVPSVLVPPMGELWEETSQPSP